MSGAPTPSTSVALPTHSGGVSWPTLAWSVGSQLTGDPDRLTDVVEAMFSPTRGADLGEPRAFLAVQGGRIVAEHYAPGITSRTTHLAWSITKSITQAAAGILVGRGLLDLAAPVGAPEWSVPGDPRSGITTDDLLSMRSGLAFVEDYVDDAASDCIEMLFGSGADDVAGYAATRPLEHPVGEKYNYSSGTTNIIVRHLARLLGATDAPPQRRRVVEELLRESIFDPLGMTSPELRFDAAGTFVGSSYLYLNARDLARFGLLYLRDGLWEDRRLLPAGWVDSARTIRATDQDNGWHYGHHWWIRGDPFGTFFANGYEGQLMACVPALDLIVVRLGRMPAEFAPAREQNWFDILGAFTAPV